MDNRTHLTTSVAEVSLVRSVPRLARDLALADWNALFQAVTGRLQRLASEHDGSSEFGAIAVDETGASPLVECVQALTQLHLTLSPALGEHRQLQAALSASEAQLARTRSELARSKDSQHIAQHQAQHDALTALPNRRYFQDRLEDALSGTAEQRPALAVLFMDLDGFKLINDEHGHHAGDETLCIVATRLAHALRTKDTVSRLGGDEFACLLVDPMTREQLGLLASKLYDAIAAPLQVGPLKLKVRASIGIAIYPQDGSTGAMLLQRADAAMYRAKRRGQGYVFFDRNQDL